tara:strand:+ start:107 stop:712 length:606 start_codon:yes stop_codon:yes gene_type:complete
MDKYNDGKIYRIDVDGCEKVYIGSCIVSLDERFSRHKCDDSSSKELFNYGEPFITLIENYSCASDEELRMREQFYMDKFIDDGYTLINNRRAYTSPAMKKDNQKERGKKYYETNKEHIKEQNKEYYETNKEHYKEYYQTNKEQKKEYYETNKEHIKEYIKEYKELNKDALNEKFICECGGKYTHRNISRHLKTKKHMKFIL